MKQAVLVLTWVLLLMEIQAQVSTDLHPHIKKLHIKSDIRYRFSTTVVTSTMVNPDDVAQEVVFDVTLPNQAFMTNFTLEIEGKVYVGDVKEKEAAKRQFERAKARGQSAGHIKVKPRETNKFNIEINLAAKGTVNFVLTYQELLQRKRGLYEHVTYINPGQLVPDFQVEVSIQESRNITDLNVPPLRKDLLRKLDPDVPQETNSIAAILRPNPNEAYILYRPSLEQQKLVDKDGLSGQFVVSYDVDRQQNAGEILLVNGYFVHYFAMDNVASLPKDVLFVLDVSGSMSGTKIAQLKDAMINILDDLNAQDNFNILTFSSGTRYWKSNRLVSANAGNIKEAKTFTRGIRAGGGTNINQAVLDGLSMLRNQRTAGRAPLLLFLTDGQPTVGVTNTGTILSNIEKDNEKLVPICSLAFGRGADYNFVKKLAGQNNCLGRKIYEDSDANLQIEGFYDEISTILLKDITFNYLNGTVDENTLTKVHFHTFFKGTEIMVAGRLADKSVTDLGLTVAGDSVNGKVSFTHPSEIVPNLSMNLTDNRAIGKITEKLWAYLTIKQLLKERGASTDPKKQNELKQRILKLALKYNFVTPMTSMVVTLPDANKQLEEPRPRPRPRPFPRPWFRKTSASRVSSSAKLAPSLNMAQASVPQFSSFGASGSLSNAGGLGLQAALPQFSPSGSFSRVRSFGRNFRRRLTPRRKKKLPPLTQVSMTQVPSTTTTSTTTSTTSTSTTSSTASTFQTHNLQLPSFIIKVPGINDALCIDFELTAGQTFLLLNYPETGTRINATFGGNGTYNYISNITAETYGLLVTLEFFPDKYIINGIEYQYSGNDFKLNEYNTAIPFDVGVIPLKSEKRLAFYIEFPTTSGRPSGRLAPYDIVNANLRNLRSMGSMVLADIMLEKGSKQYLANDSKAATQPLYSGVCWILKDSDINFQP